MGKTRGACYIVHSVSSACKWKDVGAKSDVVHGFVLGEGRCHGLRCCQWRQSAASLPPCMRHGVCKIVCSGIRVVLVMCLVNAKGLAVQGTRTSASGTNVVRGTACPCVCRRKRR